MNKCGFNFVDLVFEWFYKINVVKIQKKIPRRDIPATLITSVFGICWSPYDILFLFVCFNVGNSWGRIFPSQNPKTTSPRKTPNTQNFKECIKFTPAPHDMWFPLPLEQGVQNSHCPKSWRWHQQFGSITVPWLSDGANDQIVYNFINRKLKKRTKNGECSSGQSLETISRVQTT